MDVRAYMIYTVNHQMDLQEYKSNTLINKTNVDSFYGLDNTTYPNYVMEVMNRTKSKYKNAVSSISMYVADILTSKIESAWKIMVPTTNSYNPDATKKTQYLPLQNVFMNYLVDLDLLSLGKPYFRTIISLNYWSIVEYIISQISVLNVVISDSIEKSIVLNFVYCGIIALVIVVSIIPIYILLKKRVKRHIDIYDLIVSVEG